VTPLSVEAALAQPSFQPYSKITLSPDTRWVAYTLQYPNRNAGSVVDAWFTRTGVPSTAGGTRVRITGGEYGPDGDRGERCRHELGARLVPDGRYLAFYSDAGGLAQLWVREMASGGRSGSPARSCARTARFQIPRWTPDSRQVVMPILLFGTSLPEARPALSNAAIDSLRQQDRSTVSVLRAESALPYGRPVESPAGGTRTSASRFMADLAS